MNLPPRTKLQWAVNPEKAKLVETAFRARNQQVPNNPDNGEVDQPISWFQYDATSQGRVVMVNPYGDGSLQVVPQAATLVRPADSASLVMAPPPRGDAVPNLQGPGYGFMPEQSALARIDGAQQQTPVAPQQPMGMSTGVAIGGPQRNVPKPA